MSAYLLVDLDVRDPDGFAEYREKVPAVIAKHGGRYLTRGGPTEVIEGDYHPGRFVLIEFPDRAAAHAFFADPEYQEIQPIRHRCAPSNVVLAEGI